MTDYSSIIRWIFKLNKSLHLFSLGKKTFLQLVETKPGLCPSIQFLAPAVTETHKGTGTVSSYCSLMLPTNAPFFFFKLYFKTERSEEASHARSSERRRRQKPSLDDPRSPSSSVPSLLPFTCFSSFSLNYLVLCRLCLYMGNEQEMGRKKPGG